MQQDRFSTTALRLELLVMGIMIPKLSPILRLRHIGKTAPPSDYLRRQENGGQVMANYTHILMIQAALATTQEGRGPEAGIHTLTLGAQVVQTALRHGHRMYIRICPRLGRKDTRPPRCPPLDTQILTEEQSRGR